MDPSWHRAHRLARTASEDERVAWHLAHQQACACRPIPPSMAEAMGKRGAV